MERYGRISQFFSNQTIFLTGGTGFLGKLLIEKLLRECWDIKRIYVLVRPKKDKTVDERFDTFFRDQCFSLLKNRSFKEKVIFVSGDCDKPNLGLSIEDASILTNETTCVFHVAANVGFAQSLKKAHSIVTATRDVLELSTQMNKLKVVVFVSTAYSNCVHSDIKEDFYNPPITPELFSSMVEGIDKSTLDKMTPALLDKWPNTYVYSKCVAEDLVKTYKLEVPVAVVRPAIIINTMSEPLEGWVDNYYGPIGVTVGGFMGVVRSVNGDNNIKLNVVPADYVCNFILATTWRTATQDDKNPVVYNFTGKGQICETFIKGLESHYWEYPSVKFVWYKQFKVRADFWHELVVFRYMLLACLLDLVLFCMGKPTWVVNKYKSINRMINATSHFRLHEWTFQQDNVRKLWKDMTDEDRTRFLFDMESLDWKEYLRRCILGNRLYLLKDPIETLDEGKRKLRVLFALHWVVKLLMLCILGRIFMYVLRVWAFL